MMNEPFENGYTLTSNGNQATVSNASGVTVCSGSYARCEGWLNQRGVLLLAYGSTHAERMIRAEAARRNRIVAADAMPPWQD